MIKNNLFIFKALLSLAIISLILLQIDWDIALSVLKNIAPLVWISTIALLVVQTLVLSVRWWLIINTGRCRVTYKEALKVTFASLVANFVFLTSISGFAVKVFLSVQQGVSLLFALGASLIDRFMTLLALLILAALFMPFAGRHLGAEFLIIAGAFFIGILSVTLCLLLLSKTKAKKFLQSHRRVATTFKYMRSIFTQPITFTVIIGTSLIAQFIYFLAIFVISIAAGAEVSLLALLSVLPMIALIASLPISIGGWGVREGAFIYGLGLLGVSLEQAFLISVQIGLSGLLAAGLVGIPAWLSASQKNKNISSDVNAT